MSIPPAGRSGGVPPSNFPEHKKSKILESNINKVLHVRETMGGLMHPHMENLFDESRLGHLVFNKERSFHPQKGEDYSSFLSKER